jgi:Rieske Fe-S protein
MRDGDSVYALDLVCTHLGCTVTVTSTGLSCPCHGSRFDRQGRVLKGPADRSLGRLQVEEKDGMIEVVA